MTKDELRKLKEKLLGLNIHEQLDVTETLLGELYDKGDTFDWKKQDFLEDKIYTVISRLTSYKSNLKNQAKRQEIQELLEKIDAMTENKKSRIITAAIGEMHRIEKEESEKQAKAICAQEGHDFGDELDGWTRRDWTCNEDVRLEINYVQKCTVNHFQYNRTCTRCGFHESFAVDRKPDIILERENQAYREKRIKQLTEELDLLKSGDGEQKQKRKIRTMG